MSARENIAKDIVEQLENMSNPAPALVTREFFEFDKLAITQFPAILVISTGEDREDISTSERQGTLEVELRCFVRGAKLDTLRNNLIERIEEALEDNRDRNITVDDTVTHYVNSTITNIEVIERIAPIGQFNATLTVTYVYKRGNA
jgi:tRNA(Ser,Leu) C12 N-acetylase TAN1